MNRLRLLYQVVVGFRVGISSPQFGWQGYLRQGLVEFGMGLSLKRGAQCIQFCFKGFLKVFFNLNLLSMEFLLKKLPNWNILFDYWLNCSLIDFITDLQRVYKFKFHRYSHINKKIALYVPWFIFHGSLKCLIFKWQNF